MSHYHSAITSSTNWPKATQAAASKSKCSRGLQLNMKQYNKLTKKETITITSFQDGGKLLITWSKQRRNCK